MDNKEWYISNFPETMFPCQYKYYNEYGERVINGMDLAKKTSILICGLARNCESIIQYNLLRLMRFGSYFKDYHVFIYENNSTDDTKKILSSVNNKKFTIKCENVKEKESSHPKSQERRENMAKARNKYITFAKKYAKQNPIDLWMVVDLDLLGGWSYEGIFSSLGQWHDWDVVGSNSIYYHKTSTNCLWIFDGERYKCKYCGFVVPHPHFNKNCVEMKQNDDISKGHQRLTYDTWALRFVEDSKELDDRQANLYQFERGQSMFEVASCFGGLALYKPEILSEKIKYTSEDCDHVTLHNLLRRIGYGVYLNPSQITLYNKSQYII